jgi:hypothetical protein
VGRAYDEYHVPEGYLMSRRLPEEFLHLWYFLGFGLLAALCSYLGLRHTALPAAALAQLRRLETQSGALAPATAALVTSAASMVAAMVLQHAPIADDEGVYRVIAQILRTGAVVARRRRAGTSISSRRGWSR